MLYNHNGAWVRLRCNEHVPLFSQALTQGAGSVGTSGRVDGPVIHEVTENIRAVPAAGAQACLSTVNSAASNAATDASSRLVFTDIDGNPVLADDVINTELLTNQQDFGSMTATEPSFITGDVRLDSSGRYE